MSTEHNVPIGPPQHKPSTVYSNQPIYQLFPSNGFTVIKPSTLPEDEEEKINKNQKQRVLEHSSISQPINFMKDVN
jgi:hypothetical protein